MFHSDWPTIQNESYIDAENSLVALPRYFRGIKGEGGVSIERDRNQLVATFTYSEIKLSSMLVSISILAFPEHNMPDAQLEIREILAKGVRRLRFFGGSNFKYTRGVAGYGF